MVVLRGGRIFRLGAVGEFAYPPGSRTIDLTGEWIIPGLIDTHAHMPSPQDQEEVLKTLLAFGITTARNPATEAEAGVELRDRIARGEILGPRLKTAGNLIDAPGGIFSGVSWVTEVTTVEEVRDEVRRQVAEGVDLIKVYRGVPPALVKAAIDEAHALGRPVLGHLGATRSNAADAHRAPLSGEQVDVTFDEDGRPFLATGEPFVGVIQGSGFRSLKAGERVEVVYYRANQESFRYVARLVRRLEYPNGAA